MSSIQITHRGSYEHDKTRTKVFINWLTEAAHKCCKLDELVFALKDTASSTDAPLVAASYSTLPAASGSGFERSNAGHAHFIDVLQQAYDTFAALDKSRITRPTKSVASSADKTPLDNLFKHLEVEDPSDTHLDGDELEKLATSAPRIKFQVEPDDNQETLVQLMCLLNDTKLVSEEVEETFKQYRRGEVTLEVTCLVANIGFGIIRRACEHFSTQCPKIENYSCMLDVLGLRMVRHEDLVIITPEHHIGQDDSMPNLPITDSGEYKHRQPLVPLDEVTASLLCVSGAAIMTGLYDEAQRALGKHPGDSRPQKYHGLARILYDALPGLRKLGNKPELLVAELGQWYSDEFAAGIVKFIFGKQSGLPIWLAIVAQCYRSIHDILDGHMICGVQTTPDGGQNTRNW